MLALLLPDVFLAIEGRSFCPATKQAFEILAENATRIAAVNCVGDFVLFLGKCAVTAITALIAVLLFKVCFRIARNVKSGGLDE